MGYNGRMISLVVFLFGLSVGSFLNALIWRFEVSDGFAKNPRKIKSLLSKLITGRSQCPLCDHTLSWQDLIPLLSFLLLKGKCRYCNEKISFQYPLVELAVGMLFVLMFHIASAINIELLYLWTIVSLLTVIFVYDLKHFIIPDKVLYPAILISLIWYVVGGTQGFIESQQMAYVLYSALGAAAFFFAIYLLSKGRAMGFGDVKLALFMGMFLSWPNILVALAVAFGSGATIGLILMLLKRKTMRSEVPFGPFLILGTFTAFLWGEVLVDFYLSYFGV